MTSKEAFSFVVHELERNTNFTKDSTFGKAVDMLNDLVERDTPLKPNDNLMKDYYHCSKCGREIPECVNKHFMRYCSNCGQRLKWSDNDEL